MLEILPESSGNCIGFKISGEVEAEDYENLLPKIEMSEFLAVKENNT